MGPVLVEIPTVPLEHLEQVTLAEHEHVVEAFAAHTAQEALAESVCFGCPYGRLQHADTERAARSKSAPYLSTHPFGYREARRSRMMKRGPMPNAVAFRSCCATQVEFGLDVTPMLTILRDPSSTMKNAKSGRRARSARSHVLLHDALRDANAELQQLATDALRAPESVVSREGPDEVRDLRWDAWVSDLRAA
jgi:hypothetical protein